MTWKIKPHGKCVPSDFKNLNSVCDPRKPHRTAVKLKFLWLWCSPIRANLLLSNYWYSKISKIMQILSTNPFISCGVFYLSQLPTCTCAFFHLCFLRQRITAHSKDQLFLLFSFTILLILLRVYKRNKQTQVSFLNLCFIAL